MARKPFYQSSVLPDFDDFLGYCDGDHDFALWCQDVNRLSLRFTSTTFFEVEQYCDPAEYYSMDYSPIRFVRHCIVPELVCDNGYDFVEDVVADNVMWGIIL